MNEDFLDNEYRLAVQRFLYTDRLHRRCIESRIKKLGIHRTQHMLLMYLSRNGNVPSQKEIADEFDISSAAVAATLKLLEKNGYILRREDKDDTRRNIIEITEKGRKIIKISKQQFDQVDEVMFKGLTKEQLAIFFGCLDIIQENLRRLDENDPENDNYQNRKG